MGGHRHGPTVDEMQAEMNRRLAAVDVELYHRMHEPCIGHEERNDD